MVEVDEQGVFNIRNVIYQLLQTCTAKMDIAAARKVYLLVIKCGWESDAFLGFHLIRMFAVCSSLHEANLVFVKVSRPNAFVWGAVISANVRFKNYKGAIHFYQQMLFSCVKPDAPVFVAALTACAALVAIEEGKIIHSHLCESGLHIDKYAGSALIDMYVECGDLEDAHGVFYVLRDRDMVTWTALIAGYAQRRQADRALELYYQMQEDGIQPNQFTFTSLMKACCGEGLHIGRRVHADIIQAGFHSDNFIGCSLINMYMSCGSFHDACVVFLSLQVQSTATWTAIITGYSNYGYGEQALELFLQMRSEGIEADLVAYVSALKACSQTVDLNLGMLIHMQVIDMGLASELFICNCLIDLYGRCGCVKEACCIFDRMPEQDTVTWSAIVEAYAQHGRREEALQLFKQARDVGLVLNQAVFVSILKACASTSCLVQGKLVHAFIIEAGLQFDVVVAGALIDMYVRCESLEDSCRVFCLSPLKDVVTWSSLISGFVQCGHGHNAFQLFQQMQINNVRPNQVTFVNLLEACSITGALNQGRLVHISALESGFEADVSVGNALINMYGRCGSLDDVYWMVQRLPRRDVVTWTATMSSFTYNRCIHKVFEIFKHMQQDDIRPNNVTFICLLSACSQAGLLEKGCHLFKSMTQEHGIFPSLDHYNCMIELLSSKGCLEEAEDLIMTIPFQRNIVGWQSLLNHCGAKRDILLARECFDNIIAVDPNNATVYTLMSNLYADSGMVHNHIEVEELRKCANAWKKPGRAFIEIKNDIHVFAVKDRSHVQSDEIYAELDRISSLMVEEDTGHLTKTLEAVQDESYGHCEQLAVAFGLLNAPEGATIRVTKNLQVCNNCHTVNKLISKVSRREIIINDVSCVHHFHDGSCSCEG